MSRPKLGRNKILYVRITPVNLKYVKTIAKANLISCSQLINTMIDNEINLPARKAARKSARVGNKI